MTQAEFWEAMHAYQEEKTADRRHVGELMRGAALRLFNLQLRSQDQIKDPHRFWPMPWDETSDAALERLVGMTADEKTENAKQFLDRIGWNIEEEDDGNK